MPATNAQTWLTVVVDKSPKFTLFSKLPMELRLQIWGFAAPDPCVVVQRDIPTSKYRFAFNRPVPAVLHACRESRLEFLDEDDKLHQNGTAVTRRDHPVYKLHLYAERFQSSPAFFSSGVDTLWGLNYGTSYSSKTGLVGGLFWTGVASPDLSSELKHFAYTGLLYNLYSDPVPICEAFPKLEVLTMIIDNSKPIFVS